MNSNLLNTELNLIKNDIIRNLVKRSIDEVVPKWYEIKLASTKGNYNYSGTGIPITILSRNKTSVALLKILLNNPIYIRELDLLTIDMMYASLILKDFNMYGLGSDQDYKVTDHYLTAYELKPSGLSGLEESMFNGVIDFIRVHHGPYSNPPIDLDTTAKRLVHLCDYLSSKSTIIVDVEKELSW